MLKLLCAAMLVALALPAEAAPDPAEAKAAPAPAASPRGMMRYDTNKDGFVDRGEWTAGQEARFKQLDTDKDGEISAAEIANAPKALKALDKNNDGKISPEEVRPNSAGGTAVSTRNSLTLVMDGRMEKGEAMPPR